MEELKRAIDALQRLKADVAARSSHGPGLSHDAAHVIDEPLSVSGVSDDVLRMDMDESLVSSFLFWRDLVVLFCLVDLWLTVFVGLARSF